MRYTVEGEVPGPLGARHPTITPFQAFATSDGAIIIAAGNDGLFVKICEALGRPDMATDPDYKTNALRQKHHGKLEREIESVLKGNTTAHWLGRHRQGRRAVRADQQHRAGAGPSAGRGAQHADRGARRQRRHAEARRQSDEDVGLRRPHDAPARARPRRRPRRHPLLSSAAELGAGAASASRAGLAKFAGRPRACGAGVPDRRLSSRCAARCRRTPAASKPRG